MKGFDPLQRSRERGERDDRSKTLGPGSWIRFSDHADVRHIGKLGQITAWDDDGWNAKRAPRNKHVVVCVEPHIYGDRIEVKCRLQELLPITEMEVIAEAARD